MSNQGLIIAEINDVITKCEFISDLRSNHNCLLCDLKEVSQIMNNYVHTSEKTVLIIDELLCKNSDNVINNLNINRNWFLALNLVVVFILPEYVTTRLIEFSYNLWSCISLHRSFSYKPSCYFMPHFIDDASANYQKYSVLPSGSVKSMNILLNKYFNDSIDTTEFSDFSLNKYLKKQLDYYKNVDLDLFYELVFRLGRDLYSYEKYNIALVCFEFIENHLLIEKYKYKNFKVFEYLAKLNFRRNNLPKAAAYYEALLKFINSENSEGYKDALSEYKIAEIKNNIGVIYYLANEYRSAIEWYSQGIEDINYSEPSFQLSEILFNLSMVSYVVDDIKNAEYYIDCALDFSNHITNRFYRLSKANYIIFKAFLNCTIGNLVDAHSISAENLIFLRENINQEHNYIIEAHYINALIYFNMNDLDKAEHCVQKSMELSSRRNSSRHMRATISLLNGLILFYKQKYSVALKHLSSILYLPIWNENERSLIESIKEICMSNI